MIKFYGVIAVLLLFLFLPAETIGQIPNVQISYNSVQLQNEEQVFYCPTDSNYILANWRDFQLGYRRCGIGRSTDGGASWSNQLNMLMLDWNNHQSDPTMTVDRHGNFYCCWLEYSATAVNDSSFLTFTISYDKGATWVGAYPVSPHHGDWFEDKQFITIDRTSGVHDGNVYVAWARFDNPTRIMFARSLDSAVTFEDTLIVGPAQIGTGCGYDLDAGQFAQPIVGSDGDVYVFWRGGEITSETECVGYTALKMSKSFDGGQTWPIMAEPLFAYNVFGIVDGNIDVYNCPAGDADITGGPYDGNIYISTLNGNADDIYYHSDILLLKSTDGCETWLPPVRINDDPLGEDVDQFHPWLTVNQDGTIAVIFYDQRMDPSHYMFDVFAAYSFDGGETFTTNHRITNVSSSPDQAERGTPDVVTDPWEGMIDDNGEYHVLTPMAGKIAEYIGVTAFHDAITAVWTDTRNGNQDVFSASYTIPFLEPRLFDPVDNGLVGTGDSLVWSTSWHEDNISYRIEIDDDPLFASIDLTSTPTDNKLYTAPFGLTDGIYYWRVKAFRTVELDSTEYSDVLSFEIDTEVPSPTSPETPGEGITSRDSLPTFDWSITRDSPEYFEIEISTDPAYSGTPPYFHYDGITTTSFTMPEALPEEGTYYWHVNHYDLAGNETGYSSSTSFNFVRFICGDANGDLTINVGDAVHLINYVFKNGDPPDPLESGETNCDGAINVGDAVFVINYVFKSGPIPCGDCP
ncbi:MAG: hypothetical protein GY841_01465 [FCB group bacterium]|nr:hypothetical protein [FCB group bacterium]